MGGGEGMLMVAKQQHKKPLLAVLHSGRHTLHGHFTRVLTPPIGAGALIIIILFKFISSANETPPLSRCPPLTAFVVPIAFGVRRVWVFRLYFFFLVYFALAGACVCVCVRGWRFTPQYELEIN